MPPKKRSKSPQQRISTLKKRSRELKDKLKKAAADNAKLKERVQKLKQRSRELKDKLNQPRPILKKPGRSVSFDDQAPVDELVDDIYHRLWNDDDLPEEWVDRRAFRKAVKAHILDILKTAAREPEPVITPMSFESTMLPLMSRMIADIPGDMIEQLYNPREWSIAIPADTVKILLEMDD